MFKAHRWLYHSTLGSRVINEKKKVEGVECALRDAAHPDHARTRVLDSRDKVRITGRRRGCEARVHRDHPPLVTGDPIFKSTPFCGPYVDNKFGLSRQ